MAVPLNRIPRGLLDYFGIKSGEWGPRELGQVLAPVLELRDWYLNVDALEVACTFAAGGIFAADVPVGNIAITGTTPTTTDLISAGTLLVPQDEVWLILEGMVTLDFAALANQFGDAHWRSRGNALPAVQAGWQTSDAALARRFSSTLSRPFWSRPGDTVAISCNGIEVQAGTVSIQARIRLVRFKI